MLKSNQKGKDQAQMKLRQIKSLMMMANKAGNMVKSIKKARKPKKTNTKVKTRSQRLQERKQKM